MPEEFQPPGSGEADWQPEGWQPDSASGGGGGDTTPDPFNFVSQTGVPLSTPIISAPLTPAGFDTTTTISAPDGLEYSLDGGAYTTLDGSIDPGQSVTVRSLSSALNSTPVTRTLIIGGVSGTFTITTLAASSEVGARLRIRVGSNQVVLIDAEDHIEVTLDWQDQLVENVTLVSVSHTPPSSLTKEDEQTNSDTGESVVKVAGATHCGVYQISARATLSNGETVSRSVVLRGFNL